MRKLKLLVSLVLASAMSTLPACGTMGGGGMKYIAELPAVAGEMVSS
jgi:predicted small secreted protein